MKALSDLYPGKTPIVDGETRLADLIETMRSLTVCELVVFLSRGVTGFSPHTDLSNRSHQDAARIGREQSQLSEEVGDLSAHPRNSSGRSNQGVGQIAAKIASRRRIMESSSRSR
jgi:hypothetical protein